MPKTPEQQFFRQLRHCLWHYPHHRQTFVRCLDVPDVAHVKVALCVDGGTSITPPAVEKAVQGLYAELGIDAGVHVLTFSFLSDPGDIANQRRILDGADIFWFAGVHYVAPRLKELLRPSRDETNANDLAAHVRRRVQYENMIYIGVCGGASMVSSPATCPYGCGLDLLHDRQVYYSQEGRGRS